MGFLPGNGATSCAGTRARGACWAAALILTAGLLLAPQQAPAQFETGFRIVGAEEPVELTKDEALMVLTANGIAPDLAEKYLEQFEDDRTFTEPEVEIMVNLLRAQQEAAMAPPAGTVQPPAPAPQQVPFYPEVIYPEELGIKRPLELFGYDLFRQPPEGALPPEDITVGPEYVVGVGDQVLINIWGDLEKRYAKTVDRQGRLVLPEVGVIMAAGRTLAELREEIQGLYAKVVKNFRLTVSIGDVRTIQVYVSGDVARPGAYTLSALSTVLTALYAAGGPTEQGSLRRITLSRRGKPTREIDFYGFLLSGDRNVDVILQSGDVVHVHPIGPTVAVTGEVVRPARYEILPGETLRDVVRMAGGLTSLAYEELVTVDRFSELGETQLYKIRWSDPSQDMELRGGDEVTVYSVYQVRPKETVEIYGMVQFPGEYTLVPGMKVTDLIFRAGGILEGTYKQRAELARVVETEADSALTMVLTFPLGEILDDPDHPENLRLRKGDKVFIRSSPGWEPPAVVVLEGEVNFPGRYGLEGEEERISHVMGRAGGPTDRAFLKGAQLFRKDQGRIIIDFSVALGDPSSRDNIVLEDGDSIYVPRRPETIRVSGAVANPGLLLYVPGKKAGYYIEKTGGYTEKANKGDVKIVRVTGEIESATRRFWPDPIIYEGDEILVPEKEKAKPVDWGKTLKEAATIIASLATTVYVVAKLQ